MIGATLFAFTWLESARLKNEYRAIELSREIDRIKDELARLNEERHDLGRLKRMNEAAPDLELSEPEPGQVVIVGVSAATDQAFVEDAPSVPEKPRTRSVRIALGDDETSSTPQRVARHETDTSEDVQ
jgi:hypothetical protein